MYVLGMPIKRLHGQPRRRKRGVLFDSQRLGGPIQPKDFTRLTRAVPGKYTAVFDPNLHVNLGSCASLGYIQSM
jgi:hypothetical protein